MASSVCVRAVSICLLQTGRACTQMASAPLTAACAGCAARARLNNFTTFCTISILCSRLHHIARGGGVRQHLHLFDAQHAIHIEDDHELAAHLAHALDEIRTDRGTEARRRLDL